MRNVGDRGNSSEIRVSIRLMRETMGSFSRRIHGLAQVQVFCCFRSKGGQCE